MTDVIVFKLPIFQILCTRNVCYCVISFQTEPGSNQKKARSKFVVDKGNVSSIPYILYCTFFVIQNGWRPNWRSTWKPKWRSRGWGKKGGGGKDAPKKIVNIYYCN